MKPTLFICSSSEGLDLAYAIQENLAGDAEATVWNQGVFEPSKCTLEALEEGLDQFQFGVFVFSQDDLLTLRKEQYSAVRDVVLFELGLFVGRLGREQNFIVIPKDASDFRLPTDLLGLSTLTFDSKRRDRNLSAALGPTCRRIAEAMAKRQRLKQKYLPKKDLINLLLHFATDAFITPLPIERSLKTFKNGIKDVLELVQDGIDSTDPNFKRSFMDVFRHLKALRDECSKVKDSGRYSDYYNTGTRGIVIDSLRFAIGNRVNDLLLALDAEDRIDNYALIAEAPRFTSDLDGTRTWGAYENNIDDAKEVVRGYRLDDAIVDQYAAEMTKIQVKK